MKPTEDLKLHDRLTEMFNNVEEVCCLTCLQSNHCPILKLVKELSDNPNKSTEFYCQEYQIK